MIDKNDPRLTDFVLGELSTAEGAEIQAAIENSPELASAVDEIRQTVEMLGAAYLAEEPLRLSDEQKAELARVGGIDDLAESVVPARPNAVGGGSKASIPIRTGPRWLPIAMAATLLGLLIGGAIYLNNPATELAWGPAATSKTIPDVAMEAEPDDREPSALFGENAAGENADREKNFDVEALPDIAADSGQSNKQLLEQQKREGLFKSELPMDSISNSAGSSGGVTPDRSRRESQRARMKEVDEVETESALADFSGDLNQELANQNRSQMQRGGEARGLGRVSNTNGLSDSQGLGAPSMGGAPGSGSQSAGGLGGGGYGGRGGIGGGGVARNSRGRGAEAIVSGQGRTNAPAFGIDTYTFDSSVPTERSSGETLNRLMDATESEDLVEMEKDRAGLMKSFGGVPPNAVPMNVRDPNSAIDSNGRLEQEGRLGLIIPESTDSPAPKLAAPAKTQMDGAQPAPLGVDNPTAGVRVAPRFAGAEADKKNARNDLEGQVVDAKSAESLSGKELKSKGWDGQQMWGGYRDLGIKIEEQIVNEVRERITPVERIRIEERMRKIKQPDGTFKEEKYEVEVPYTQQQTRNYTVQVPKRVLLIEPEKSRELVEKLASRVDPGKKRELKLQDLLEYAEKSGEAKPAENGDSDAADGESLQIANRFFLELKDEEKAKQANLDSSVLLVELGKSLAKRNAEVRRTKSWKRVKATPNTSRLMVGNKEELDLVGMQANVQVDGFRARVLIDCFYYNDRDEQLEGNFKLRLPDDASLYYFAFGESAYDFNAKGELAKEEFLGDDTQFVSLDASDVRETRKDAWANVKEARMVPREKAAHAFRETVRQKIDPALAEWSGAGVFNARVFPLAPKKLHRIVIGYDVNLTRSNGDLVYEFDLPDQVAQCRVDLNVQPINGVEYRIEPDSDPFEKLVDGVTQRKYRFDGPQKNGIRLTASKSPEVLLQTLHDQEGGFWGVQITPDLPVEQVTGNARAIFMVDTSLSSNPDKFNTWLKLLEATLTNNRGSLKQFGVVFFNVDGHFWQDQYVDNTEQNVAKLMATCETLALEGATDLYGAVEKVAQADWIYQSDPERDNNPASGPDLFLLSDGAANWGETNLRLIDRQLRDHQLGSLFAYQTGYTGTAIAGLRFLAGQSGGAVFSVADEAEIKTASTAHRNRPWKLESIAAVGATDIMTAGRVQWVYPGQTITLVGRGKVAEKIELNLNQSGESKSISISPTRVQSELASRLYGQVAVGQLESLGAKVFDVAASYARHFRVTGDSCSLLMLETEADYKRFDIKPEEDLFVIKTKAAEDLVAETLKKSAGELADPKAQLLAWLQRLETMPGLDFKLETAFKLALDDIQIVPVSKPLDCSLTQRNKLSKKYLSAVQKDQLDYGVIAAEAQRRGRTSVDDAIKVLSSLVERNPGDMVVARDVAFTAMELGRPAQAYHLLRNVARARPYEGSIYPALGQCLTQLGQSDLAIVYYEIALGGTFQRQGEQFRQIVSAEYLHLLRQIVAGKLDSSVKDFANARLETLSKKLDFESADLLITMMWNTDQTDVDLHVVEPSGEECSYENKTTLSGGQITSDITTGFGPEMYSNPTAPKGKYQIQVKYFGNDQNRTSLQNKVYLTIYREFGTRKERVTRRTIQLNRVGEKETVATIGVEK